MASETVASIKAFIGTTLALAVIVFAICAIPVIVIGLPILAAIAVVVFILIGVYVGLKEDFKQG
jgi:uncharacterized membrane protein